MILDRLRNRTIRDDDGSPYLTRWYLVRVLRQWLPGVFPHYFHRSDHDRELHNHPWRWAVAIILKGGYYEHRYDSRTKQTRVRYLPPISVSILTPDIFHRVVLLDEARGSWSLFIAGPRFQEWGFLDIETGQFESNTAREARLERERRRT